MVKNILLTIEYDGSLFHGWQRQPGMLTVQGYLEKTISGVLKENIRLNGTSRTDAGVHALGQRASFFTNSQIPVNKIALVINNALKGKEKNPYALSPVRIIDAEEKPEVFHARFDCKGKKYIYRIMNCGCEDVFSRNYICHVKTPLDIKAMRTAAGYLIGTHDFRSFEASGGNPRKTTVRTIYSADLICEENAVKGTDIQIHICGDGFLYNMVRIISGTLIEIGIGKKMPQEMKKIIKSCNREMAGYTAPPFGLYLAEVFY